MELGLQYHRCNANDDEPDQQDDDPNFPGSREALSGMIHIDVTDEQSADSGRGESRVAIHQCQSENQTEEVVPDDSTAMNH